MSGFVGHNTRISPPAGRKPGTVDPSDERRTRRHARDFSNTSITWTGDAPSSSSSTPQGPDIEKDLPRIPSTSRRLLDREPVTTSFEMMPLQMTSSTRSLPPVPTLRRVPTTEAQMIAARYRRRYGSLEALKSEVSCPPELEHLVEVDNPGSQAGPFTTSSDTGLLAISGAGPATCFQVSDERMNLVPDDSSIEEHLSVDNDSEFSSFLPVTPTIRRFFAREVDMAATSSEAREILKKINQDGSFLCPQRGCYDVLPTREAYTCHVHIHLIHEELRLCELCGTRFIDDDHKIEHLSSCPRHPTFHEIENFNNKPPTGPLQNFLNRLHP